MVELICLACGRTNPSDAKFCSHCGAALLRRFCERCRAVNDAEAHFCHSCGAALSEQLLPAASTPRADDPREETRAPAPPAPDFPTLTEVMAGDDAAATAAQTLQPMERPEPTGVAEVPDINGAPGNTRPSYRRALLAVGGLIVLLVAVALWWRAPRTDVRPREADTGTTRGAASADLPAQQEVPLTPTGPAGTATTGNSEPVEATAPPPHERTKAGEADTEAQPAPFAPPRTATSPQSGPAEARRPPAPRPPPRSATPSPPPAPITECTPQRDALGLCAPGATITGR